MVAGTLLLQGASLPWLARRLRVPSPDPAEDALARATLLQQASKAGFRALAKEEYEDHHGVTEEVKRRVEQRNFAAWEQLGPNQDDETPSEQYTRLRRVMIDAERARVLQVRSGGAVASDVVAEVLAMLDVEESMLDAASRSRDELRATGTAEQSRRADDCPDLEAHPRVEVAENPECPECVAEGLRWVHLRQCLGCGHVGCCDSSPGRHAMAHFRETCHPVAQSAEVGESLALVLRAPPHRLRPRLTTGRRRPARRASRRRRAEASRRPARPPPRAARPRPRRSARPSGRRPGGRA